MPANATAPSTPETPAPGQGSAGQTFLVGELVYIRAIETGDAQYGSAWRHSAFPLSPGRVEDIIKEDISKGGPRPYIIVRKSDDVPVGALWATYDGPAVTIHPHIDTVYGDLASPWLTEALTMALPWLVEEQHRPSVLVRVPGNETAAIAAMEAIGARQTARFREMYLVNGQWQDEVILELLNKQWVQRLGDPNEIELPRTGTGEARPVPAAVELDNDPPLNAVRVGRRVYLRPFEEKDGPVLAKLTREEPETFFDTGRRLYSGTGVAAWHDSLQKKDPPAWIRFAICLRQSDEVIGGVGIDGIDRVHAFAESESEVLNAQYRDQGYGTEAKHLLLDYAFNTLNLHSLQSYVLWENTRSAAALRKQGYREAGRINWTYAWNGKFGSVAVFDLLAEEWRALPRADAGE